MQFQGIHADERRCSQGLESERAVGHDQQRELCSGDLYAQRRIDVADEEVNARPADQQFARGGVLLEEDIAGEVAHRRAQRDILPNEPDEVIGCREVERKLRSADVEGLVDRAFGGVGPEEQVGVEREYALQSDDCG